MNEGGTLMAVYSKRQHHNGNGRLKKSLSNLGNKIEKNTSSAISKMNRKTTRIITKQPYRSMGIIMLAGVCLGYIIHRND